ncbi:hypothetical protein [Psychroserpens sp.]|uniref:hypothetical protein n=1 Tax=Psychroserpens sp. TaxID=2020870 RepID=UPI001B0A1B3A|nr:hypothetical protein [Psychroserpens sp.]MBO6606595.1 hypothetical protein [Psychroserpens sp.]MBO6631942.1 hypothetical protein [Psychroserpens sp.]MBO6653299.1 hypothetical protein [Psychroserpens sp.]MBO6680674.1 hypothetical protein [Psychroserpens sp.]MBO6750368.1 hypothetical protein [Psychroserpens sp.]
MTDSSRKKTALILIWISAVVMIIHFIILDYDTADFWDLLGPLSNVLLIIAMYTVVRDVNKKAKE